MKSLCFKLLWNNNFLISTVIPARMIINDTDFYDQSLCGPHFELGGPL